MGRREVKQIEGLPREPEQSRRQEDWQREGRLRNTRNANLRGEGSGFGVRGLVKQELVVLE
jgi:hypothetical protein